MKIIKALSLVIILCILSCKKDGWIHVDTIIEIQVKDTQGQDLLNSPAVYSENNITVTYITTGPTDQNPITRTKKFEIIKQPTGLNILKVFPTFPHRSSKDRQTITLIQFGTAKPDTLRSEFEINGGSVVGTKVWFNAVLKAQKTSNADFSRSFTIVK